MLASADATAAAAAVAAAAAEQHCGSSPKQESKVLFPGALPLASAGVGGYYYIYIIHLSTKEIH